MTEESTEEVKKQKQSKAEKNEQDELREEIENLQKEKDELFAKLQRVSADYANFQKRVPKQVSDTTLYEKERIIKEGQSVYFDPCKKYNIRALEDTWAVSINIPMGGECEYGEWME